MRVSIEKSTNHGVFVILIKPTIQNYEWSVFRLDSVVEISLDKSKSLIIVKQAQNIIIPYITKEFKGFCVNKFGINFQETVDLIFSLW